MPRARAIASAATAAKGGRNGAIMNGPLASERYAASATGLAPSARPFLSTESLEILQGFRKWEEFDARSDHDEPPSASPRQCAARQIPFTVPAEYPAARDHHVRPRLRFEQAVLHYPFGV